MYNGILLFFTITMPIVVHSWSIQTFFSLSSCSFFRVFFLRRCVCLKHILLLHSQPLLLFLPNGIITHFAFVVSKLMAAATSYSTVPASTYAGHRSHGDPYQSSNFGKFLSKYSFINYHF
jgi:hypothetical protein